MRTITCLVITVESESLRAAAIVATLNVGTLLLAIIGCETLIHIC